LTSLTISASITSIGTYAFGYCSGLTSIHVNSATPITLGGSSVFGFVDKTKCTLYVPTGAKSAYQAATIWKDFTNIVETASGLPSISQSDIKLVADNGKLSVENAEPGSMVQVFSTSGVKIKDMKIASSNASLSLPAGVYVIRVGNYVAKVVMK